MYLQWISESFDKTNLSRTKAPVNPFLLIFCGQDVYKSGVSISVAYYSQIELDLI